MRYAGHWRGAAHSNNEPDARHDRTVAIGLHAVRDHCFRARRRRDPGNSGSGGLGFLWHLVAAHSRCPRRISVPGLTSNGMTSYIAVMRCPQGSRQRQVRF
jgi:hypothetical protein